MLLLGFRVASATEMDTIVLLVLSKATVLNLSECFKCVYNPLKMTVVTICSSAHKCHRPENS